MLPVRLLTPSTLKGENGRLKREISNDGKECKRLLHQGIN